MLSHAKKLVESFKTLGLTINPSKSELFSLNDSNGDARLQDFNHTFPGLKVQPKSQWLLLGAPLTDEAHADFIESKRDTLSVLLNNVNCIESHQGFFILTHFLYVPKLMYSLRASPLYKQSTALESLDAMVTLA